VSECNLVVDKLWRLICSPSGKKSLARWIDLSITIRTLWDLGWGLDASQTVCWVISLFCIDTDHASHIYISLPALSKTPKSFYIDIIFAHLLGVTGMHSFFELAYMLLSRI
jgi:hypothetical protein